MGGPNWLRRRVLARIAFLGISQQQLARLASIEESALSRALRRSDRPRSDLLGKIGRVLDMSEEELREKGPHNESVVRPHRGIMDEASEDWETQIRTWLSKESQ